MDSQLPRDPMEDFLRQSLGDYRPDPPDDMWDRISVGMGAPSSLPPATAAPATAWLSVAATVLMLVIAVAQYYYYNAHIKRLSGELEMLQQSSQPSQESGKQLRGSVENAQESESTAGQVMVAGLGGINSTTAGSLLASPSVLMTAGAAHQVAVVMPPAASPEAEVVPGLTSALPAIQRISSPLDWLPRTRVQSSLLQGLAAVAPRLPTDVVRRPLSVVAQGGFLHKSLAFDNTQPDDNGPRPDRSPRVETDIVQATARFAGLKAITPLGSRWRLSAGLSLMTSSVQAVHHSDFQVGDRNRGHRHDNRPPRGEWDNDFDCSLPSLSGSVTVGLRVEQLQVGGALNEEARVDFDIHTTEEVTRLMLPVGIGYELAGGRLSVVPELGLMAGMNLSESNRITAATINQQNAYFDSRINPFLDEVKSNTFSMDITAAMAFNWQMNDRFSIGLQPMVMRRLQLNASDKQYQQTAWGGAVSLGYQL